MKKALPTSVPATAVPTPALGKGGDVARAGSGSDVAGTRTGCVNHYIP